nr:4018_t:CDS:2 [Entrophospora candida]
MSEQKNSLVKIVPTSNINNSSLKYNILVFKNDSFEINGRYYDDPRLRGPGRSIFDFSDFYKVSVLTGHVVECYINEVTLARDLLTDIQKGLKYEYMLYKQIEKNNVLSYSNKTQFYVDGNWINISDGNIDLHGNFNNFEYVIQAKWKSSSQFIIVEEVERFIGTMVDQLNKFGFFVSNVGYSEKAINRVRNSSKKDSNLSITKDGTINVAGKCKMILRKQRFTPY